MTEVENTYNFGKESPEKRAKIYKPSNCIYRNLLKTIKTYCNCYPSYIGNDEPLLNCSLPTSSDTRVQESLKDNVKDHVNTTNLQECNFYLHGVCISFLFNRFS